MFPENIWFVYLTSNHFFKFNYFLFFFGRLIESNKFYFNSIYLYIRFFLLLLLLTLTIKPSSCLSDKEEVEIYGVGYSGFNTRNGRNVVQSTIANQQPQQQQKQLLPQPPQQNLTNVQQR